MILEPPILHFLDYKTPEHLAENRIWFFPKSQSHSFGLGQIYLFFFPSHCIVVDHLLWQFLFIATHQSLRLHIALAFFSFCRFLALYRVIIWSAHHFPAPPVCYCGSSSFGWERRPSPLLPRLGFPWPFFGPSEWQAGSLHCLGVFHFPLPVWSLLLLFIIFVYLHSHPICLFVPGLLVFSHFPRLCRFLFGSCARKERPDPLWISTHTHFHYFRLVFFRVFCLPSTILRHYQRHRCSRSHSLASSVCVLWIVCTWRNIIAKISL